MRQLTTDAGGVTIRTSASVTHNAGPNDKEKRMTTIILETLMRHLDAFPHLQNEDRAQIFAAYEGAPDVPIPPGEDSEELWEAHWKSGGWNAWRLAREIPLAWHSRAGHPFYALTLDEIAGGEAAPTKTEILTVLARAVDRAKELHA